VSILNKQSRTADTEWSSSLGVGQGASNPPPTVKLNVCYETLHTALDQDGLFSTASLVGKPEGDHSEDRGVGGRMGSEWMFGRLAGGGGGFDWLKIRTKW
jgi:hypothetical protein